MKRNNNVLFFIATLFILVIGLTAINASDIDNQTVHEQTGTHIESHDIQETHIVANNNRTDNADNKIKTATTRKENTKNIKKSTKYTVTNDTFNEYFDQENNGTLSSRVQSGDTLDFQGKITKNGTNILINKPVNIISSTHDAYIDLNTTSRDLTGTSPGVRFGVLNGADYTNITGIYLHNTQFWISNVSHVTIDNTSAVVENHTIGGGVGQTSIRDNSSFITVKNSHFYTENNGGSSTLVLAWANNCTIENNTIEGKGEIGNLLYLTTFNVFTAPDDVTPSNDYNLIVNNRVGRPAGTSISWSVVLSGKNNTVLNNTLYGGYIQFQWGTANAPNTTIIGNTLKNGGIQAGTNAIIKDNDVNGELILLSDTVVENNTFKGASIQSNTILNNNTITGQINITGSYNSITNNIINSTDEYAITRGTNSNITDNYITTRYKANMDAVIEGTGNIYLNNTPDTGKNITITNDNYNNYFSDEGKLINSEVTNYSTITVSGELDNKSFSFSDIIITLQGEHRSTKLVNTTITSDGTGRIKISNLTINNTDTENPITLNTDYNTIENIRITDNSQSAHTILLTGNNNLLQNNNINSTQNAITVQSSYNNITGNKIDGTVILDAANPVNGYNYLYINNITTSQPNAIIINKNSNNNTLESNTVKINSPDNVTAVKISSERNYLTYNYMNITSANNIAAIMLYDNADNNILESNRVNSTTNTNNATAITIALLNNNNNTIYANTLQIKGYNTYGIYSSKTDNNNITRNTINSNGNNAVTVLIDGKNNNITNNNLQITSKNSQKSVVISIQNGENNLINNTQINTTNAPAITLINNTGNIITHNTINTKNSNAVIITNDTNDLIENNTITTDTQAIIVLNNSSNNQVNNNSLTTQSAYTITLNNSRNNNITNNYMVSNGGLADSTVRNPEDNMLKDNMPSFENGILINNQTYSNYFDTDGNTLPGQVPADALIVIVGEVYDKNMIFNTPVNIAVYGNHKINNGTIIFSKGSDGSKSTNANNTLLSNKIIASNIIINNTNNINISAVSLISINNSTNITLTNSTVNTDNKNTGITVNNSENILINLNTIFVKYIGLSITNTHNLTFNSDSSDTYSIYHDGYAAAVINGNSSDIDINIKNMLIRQNSRTSKIYGIELNGTDENPVSNINIKLNSKVSSDSNIHPVILAINYCNNSTFNGNLTHGDDSFTGYLINNSNNNLFNLKFISEGQWWQKGNIFMANITNSNNNTIKDINFTPKYGYGIILNNSNNNHITNNNITVYDNYTIRLYNSTNNIITDNYLNSTKLLGDYSVQDITKNNIITNNTPTVILLTDDNYNQYFDENNNYINQAEVIQIGSNLTNRKLNINHGIYIYNPDKYTLYNTRINLNNADNSIIKELNFNTTTDNNKIITINNSTNTTIINNTIISNNKNNIAIQTNNTINTSILNNTIDMPQQTSTIPIQVINTDNITIANNTITTRDLIGSMGINTVNSVNITLKDNLPILAITDENYNQYFDSNGIFKYSQLDTIILGSDIHNKNMTFTNTINIQNPDNYTIYNGTVTLKDDAANSKLTNISINNTDDRQSSIIIQSANTTISESNIYQENNKNHGKIILVENFNGYIGLGTNNITFNGNNITAVDIHNITSTYISIDLESNNISGKGNNDKILNIVNITSPIAFFSENMFKINTTEPTTLIYVENSTTTSYMYFYGNYMYVTANNNNTPLLNAVNSKTIYAIYNFIESKDLKGDAAVKGGTLVTGNYPEDGLGKLANITADIQDTYKYNQTYPITITINSMLDEPITTGTLSVRVYNDKTYTFKNTNGTITFNLTISKPRVYGLSIEYETDDMSYMVLDRIHYYWDVLKIDTNITLPDIITHDKDEVVVITGKLTDEYNRVLNDTNITLNINNETVNLTTDANGEYSYDYTTSITGVNNVTVIYQGNDYFNTTSAGTSFTVRTGTSTAVNNITCEVYDDITLIASVIDEYGNPVNDGRVTFSIDGNILTDNDGNIVYVDVINGTANITTVFNRTGNYHVETVYTGTGNYTDSASESTVEVNEISSNRIRITVDPVNAQEQDTVSLTARLETVNNIRVDGGLVIFKINGRSIRDNNGKVIYVTVKNGLAVLENYTIPVDLSSRTNEISVLYTGTDTFETTRSAKTVMNISKRTADLEITDSVAAIGETIQLNATVTDTKHATVDNGKVVFKINGRSIRDSNGKVIYAEVHNGTASLNYTIPDYYNSNNVKVSCVFFNDLYNRCDATSTLTITGQ